MSTGADDVPEIVLRAQRRADTLGFEMSCKDGVGALLAALAAAVPADGRIVELGTGAGVGLAWLLHGVGARDDVTVYTVDLDGRLQDVVADDSWPECVHFVRGDGAQAVAAFAPIDLVFADAPGGKLDGLDQTIAALAPGGVLVVDDMAPSLHVDDGLAQAIAGVRDALLAHCGLVVAELGVSTGVIMATRRADA